MPVIERDGKAVGTSPEVEGVKTLSESIKQAASKLKPEQKEIHKEPMELAGQAKEQDSQLSQAATLVEKQSNEIKRLRNTGDDHAASMIEDLEQQLAFHQENTAQRLLGVCAYLGIPMTLEQATSICRHTPKS